MQAKALRPAIDPQAIIRGGKTPHPPESVNLRGMDAAATRHGGDRVAQAWDRGRGFIPRGCFRRDHGGGTLLAPTASTCCEVQRGEVGWMMSQPRNRAAVFCWVASLLLLVSSCVRPAGAADFVRSEVERDSSPNSSTCLARSSAAVILAIAASSLAMFIRSFITASFILGRRSIASHTEPCFRGHLKGIPRGFWRVVRAAS